ncbi:hypothetical protein BGZ51_009595 [Haplosporangium sp. Z 767]|nr:hypothetical protein BGZ51_009595 [Haplosporangium sp. Z 767]
MMLKGVAIVACLTTAAVAQVDSIFCQARYITNVATCILGVKECNTVERFSACVCSNTGDREGLRQCLIALLKSPEFNDIVGSHDVSTLS